jgi:hypothetical protein
MHLIFFMGKKVFAQIKSFKVKKVCLVYKAVLNESPGKSIPGTTKKNYNKVKGGSYENESVDLWYYLYLLPGV